MLYYLQCSFIVAVWLCVVRHTYLCKTLYNLLRNPTKYIMEEQVRYLCEKASFKFNSGEDIPPEMCNLINSSQCFVLASLVGIIMPDPVSFFGGPIAGLLMYNSDIKTKVIRYIANSFAHRFKTVTDDGVRSAFNDIWDSDVDFSAEKGLTVVEIMDAIHDGEIRGMYILGENPAMSDPDVDHARDALKMLEHLIVQDIFVTETANYADVILPASAFAEKSGTVTNTNRQVQMGRQAVLPPGEAKQDWWITTELAKRLGLNWSYTHPSQVFAEMKLGMKSLENITWDRLEKENAVTYPSFSEEDPGQPIVFGDGFPRVDGRAKFTPANVIAPDEIPDLDYPMILTTGRQLEHWHTGSMTRRSNVLDAVEPEANCSMHPKTIRALGANPGELVRLTTRRGTIEIMVRSDRAVSEDMVFLPFAYVEAAANILTNSALDPFGKIPEFKFCAVKVEMVKDKIAAE